MDRNWLDSPTRNPESRVTQLMEIDLFISRHGVERFPYVPPEEDLDAYKEFDFDAPLVPHRGWPL